MRCSIVEMLSSFPLTNKERDDLSVGPEKERQPQLTHKVLGQLNNGVAQVSKKLLLELLNGATYAKCLAFPSKKRIAKLLVIFINQ